MAYTMRATLYRESSHVGKPYDPQSELRGGVALRAEEATPAELNTSGVMMEVRHLLIPPFFHALPRPSTPSHALPMMEVRHPDLWDQRFELDALVDSYRRARLPSGQHALDEVQAAERMGLPLNQVRHLAVSPYISHHLPSSIIASHHLPSPPITSHHLPSPPITSHPLPSPPIPSHHLPSPPITSHPSELLCARVSARAGGMARGLPRYA